MRRSNIRTGNLEITQSYLVTHKQSVAECAAVTSLPKEPGRPTDQCVLIRGGFVHLCRRLLLAGTITWMLLLSPGGRCEGHPPGGLFWPARLDHFVGDYPSGLAIADLNGDSYLDAAITAEHSDELVILVGQGNGLFLAGPVIPTAENPSDVQVEDMNGDGLPDLIVVCTLGDRLSVYLAEGPLVYSDPLTYPIGGNPRKVVIARLDGDAVPDVAVSAGNQIAILLGRGGGMLGSPMYFSAGPCAQGIASDDLNKDNHADLVVTNDCSGDLSIFLGNGTGSFSLVSKPHVGATTVTGVALGDLDGDGHADAVSGTYVGLSVLYGRGDGTFDPNQYLTNTFTWPVSIVDLNGDSIPDIIAGEFNARRIGIFSGRGNRTFASPSYVRSGATPYDLEVARLDGDPLPDIAFVDGTKLGVLLATDVGIYPSGDPEPSADNPTDVSIGDLNGDLAPDLVVTSSEADEILVRMNDGTGRFLPAISMVAGDYPTRVLVRDWTCDAVPDIAILNTYSSNIMVYVNSGDGGFAPPRTTDLGMYSTPYDFACGDLNGDSVEDIVVAKFSTGALGVLLGDGDGDFTSSPDLPTPYPQVVAIGDINADGFLDAICVDRSRGALVVFPGVGDGTFLPEVSYPLFGEYFSLEDIAVADVNGDGYVDVVGAVASVGSEGVMLQLNAAGRALDPPILIETGFAASRIDVADINADGFPDITTSNYIAGDNSILLGHGDGTFSLQGTYGGSTGDGLAVHDMNGDTALDLIGTSLLSDEFSVLSGTVRYVPTSLDAGVTVLIHGFLLEGDGVWGDTFDPVNYWGTDFVTSLLDVFGGGEVFVYDPDSGRLVKRSDPEFIQDGRERPLADGGHGIILHDWAKVSNDWESGQSEAAAEALFAALTEFSIGPDSLLDFQHDRLGRSLHIIGHSRGCAVASELVQRLGYYGFPVAYFTNLDPHDFDEPVIPPDNYFLDPQIQVWTNVRYADNFWQTSTANLVPSGRPLDHLTCGFPHEMDLTGLPGFRCEDSWWNNSHSRTIRWYLGTIVPGSQDPSWYPDGFGYTSGMSRWLASGGFSGSGEPSGADNPCDPRSLEGFLPAGMDEPRDHGSLLLFNGDFDLEYLDGSGITGDNSLAGWSFHGGGGDGHLPPGGDPWLQLDFGDSWRTHNRFWTPSSATEIRFGLEIANGASGGALEVLLNDGGADALIGLLSLASSWSGFQTQSCPIPPASRGKVNTLTFRVSGGIWYEVNIDDVELVTSGEPVGVPEKTLLPSDTLTCTPNPMTRFAQVSFQLKQAGRVELRIFDLAGRVVRNLLVQNNHPAGTVRVSWDGRNEHGNRVGSGVYFLTLRTQSSWSSKKILVVR
jgi:hypothetical protein